MSGLRDDYERICHGVVPDAFLMGIVHGRQLKLDGLHRCRDKQQQQRRDETRKPGSSRRMPPASYRSHRDCSAKKRPVTRQKTQTKGGNRRQSYSDLEH